ncbi:DUF3098 domain-containing protein [Flammeovirga yaeyamensis]|uniref:DUF3098 domain-containing protein n=1 Tax=Flammeovirga yaeyamensis TaxID=367791 RepID=A0AAX1N5X9_9BACT|nr:MULTISPECIES: DUF3098 domain-containing protein [Flammeovirga]ANQ51323.2 DUF3098 domain-containing protein [Flammeovirga sp. MY04]MBB3698378.1 putative membrane protein [Flammeovirga yaeyamensis]NMF34270.1 DUF3098 domain-containing protein [Flammeovirga yaeyamensis]QWG01253.1 DUF3098 domain-containing protein [Flammeovirga yaeyamensis]
MSNNKEHLAFGKKNFVWMLIGIFTIVIGFAIMSMETAAMGFGSLGLTVGPIIVVAGFGINFYAILLKTPSAPEE